MMKVAILAMMMVCCVSSSLGVSVFKTLKKDSNQHALHEAAFKDTIAHVDTATTISVATSVAVATSDSSSSDDSATSSSAVPSVPYSSVEQLTVSTDLATLTTEIARGLVSKSTTVMIAWQAAEASNQAVKEIHSLAGGEAGVTSGRTWVYNVTAFADIDTWMTTYAIELAAHGTYSASAGTVSWVIESSPVDEPSNATCEAFATAIGNGDLAAALVIASFSYTQDLLIDSSVLAAQVSLQTGGSLIAERYDSSCLGYKFFNYYDAPTQWGTTSTITPTFTD